MLIIFALLKVCQKACQTRNNLIARNLHSHTYKQSTVRNRTYVRFRTSKTCENAHIYSSFSETIKDYSCISAL